MPRRPAEGASSDPRGAAAADDVVADGAAIAERVYRVAVTSRSRLAVAAVAIEYSLSSRSAPYVAYPMPGWQHKDAADSVAVANSRARDS